MPIGINVDLRNRWYKQSEDERRRLDQQDQLYRQLLSEGHDPDTASYLAEQSVKKGVIATEKSLPTYRNLLTSNEADLRPDYRPPPKGQSPAPNRPVKLPPVAGVPERSTLLNFKPKKKETVGVVDESGNVTQVPIEDGTDIKRFINKPQPTGYYDASGKFRFSAPGKSRILGDEKDPARERFIKQFDLYTKREYPSEGDIKYMASFASSLGLEPNEIPTQSEPRPEGFIRKAEAYIAGEEIEKGGDRARTKFNSAEEVRSAFKAGKISRDAAKEYLKGFGYK